MCGDKRGQEERVMDGKTGEANREEKRDDKGWTQTRDRGGRGASNMCESRRGSARKNS